MEAEVVVAMVEEAVEVMEAVGGVVEGVAEEFHSNNVELFKSNSVNQCQDKNVELCRNNNAKLCQDNNAELLTNNNAEMCQDRNAHQSQDKNVLSNASQLPGAKCVTKSVSMCLIDCKSVT